MSSRPSSRATAEDEGTSSLRTSTAKRPLTRPVAPRLSTSSTATRPTSTSTARTSVTTSSSLNKPPARPTTTTTSAVKRPSTTTTPSTSSLHRARPSSTSVEASGDESKRDGITARPKRTSLVSSSSTDKTTTLSSRTTRPTPTRNINSSTSSSTLRSSVKSPTTVTKPTLSSATRPTSTSTSRTRPTSMTAARSVTGLAERNRLSTIPSSPAVKDIVESSDDNKENEAISDSEKISVRPALGTKNQTRSALMEQRIHEFELVSQMLHSAMTSDGMDSDEDDHVQHDNKNPMSKLLHDLKKVRKFEKEHGRLPTEAELADIGAVPEDEDASATKDAVDVERAEKEIANLKEELEDSHGQIEDLKSHLTELTSRMEYFGKSAAEESQHVQEAAKAIQSEHASKIAEMLNLHKSQLEELEISYQNKLNEATETHASKLKAVQDSKDEEFAKKNIELEGLRAQIKEAKDKAAIPATTEPNQDAESDRSELEEVKKKLKAVQDRHSLAKDNAKSKIAKAHDEHAKEIQDLKAEHSKVLLELHKQLNEAQNGSNDQDEELVREKEAHAETLLQVQAIRDQLEEAKKSKDADIKTYMKTIEELRKQVGSLEESKSELKRLSDESAANTKITHEESIRSFQSQLDTAHSDLQTLVETNQKRDSDALQNIKEKLRLAEQKVVTVTSDHDQLRRKLETELQAAKTANQTSERDHKTAIDELKRQLDTAANSFEMRDDEHTKQLELFQAQVTSKDKEISNLKDDHLQQISKLEADHKLAHQAELDALKQANAKQISVLEKQSRSALKDLEGLETATNARMEQIKADGAASQKQALEELAASHKSAISKLEDEHTAMRNSIADIRQSHEQEMSKLKSDHTQDKKSALATLSSEHKQKLADLQSQSQSFNDDNDALKSSHAQVVQKHEFKIKALNEELDAAQFQVQSLKGILQNTEQEIQQKEEEHQQELEKANHDFSQAITKLSAQSLRIADLEVAQKQAVEEAKAAVEAETQASLDALKQEHDDALVTLGRQVDDKYQATLATLRTEHSSAIESLTKEVDIRDQDIEKLKVDHVQALSSLHSSSQQANVEAIERLKLDHSRALSELQSSLETKYESSIKDLHEKHSSEIQTSSKGFSESLAQTKAEHEDVVASLRSDLDQLREKLHDTSEVDALNSKLSESQQAFANLEAEQVKTISNTSKEHASEVAKLQTQIHVLEQEVKKAADTTELDSVKSDLATTKAKIADLTNTHANAINKKDTEHVEAIKALQHELDEAKAAASSAAQNSTEVEETKNLLADAKRTITELSEQYAVASMEAENQRLTAEAAKKELADLKKSLSEVSVTPGNSTNSKKPDARAMNSNTKSSPSSGLKASKWATVDPEQPTIDSSSTNGDEQEGLGINSAAANGDVQKPRSSHSDVVGQMAGIQESIRQLAEINEELLEGHQKWARTLSHVDDDGTVTVSQPLGTKESSETM